ncbi:MAG TPA: type II toxin-antitoxin system ParD family antitoxin [Terracidiphilus sp.]|nr:type II toxin-antitoxin system ParD family antitoxin [Terracidiphilus sp.]
MPTRNVNLPKELDRFVASRVKSGNYANASEVMRTALRLLKREEREDEGKLAALRAAITAGDAGGVVDGEEFFDELFASIEGAAKRKSKKIA